MREVDEPCCPPEQPLQPLPTSDEDANVLLAGYAKALGHPARVAIMRLLITKEGCIVGDIVDELPLAQSTISQHLKQLRSAGLIRGDVDGPRVCYCVEPAALTMFTALLEALRNE